MAKRLRNRNPATRLSGLTRGCEILNSLASRIAVIDPAGTILFTNKAWDCFAQQNGTRPLTSVGLGANYLKVCTRAVMDGAPSAQEVLSGIQDILHGKRASFSTEYPFDSPTERRWFTMTVTPLPSGRGAILSHLNTSPHQIADQENARQRSQEEIKSVLDNSPDAIQRVDRYGRYLYVNEKTMGTNGLPPEAFLGKNGQEMGFPERLCNEWDRITRAVFETGLPKVSEFRFPTRPVTYWEQRAIPEFGPDGTVRSVLKISRDITERKKMQAEAIAQAAEIRSLVTRLIVAEEDERRRLARELHDSLLQQLASLSMESHALGAVVPNRAPAQHILQDLQTTVAQMSDAVRGIAYKLHPAILEDLGLQVALKELCARFAGETNLVVRFRKSSPLPFAVPMPIATCFYRVTEEALQNIAKHAHAKRVAVKLVVSREQLLLSIQDDGRGFDAAGLKRKGRLGLVSMKERALLVGAKFSLLSRAGEGTRIHVSVPRPA